MKKAKSNEKFNYKEAITKENKRLGLRARQKKVVTEIMESIKNNEEGGVKKMVVKGGVKQAVKTKMAKKNVPPKVDLKKVEENAIRLLNELKNSVNLNGIKDLKLVPTRAGYVSYKIKNRIVFSISYTTNNKLIPCFVITREQFKGFKSLGGVFGVNSWWAEFKDFNPEKDDIKKFVPVAEIALARYKTKPKSKLVTKKVVAKKAVKSIVKHI